MRIWYEGWISLNYWQEPWAMSHEPLTINTRLMNDLSDYISYIISIWYDGEPVSRTSQLLPKYIKNIRQIMESSSKSILFHIWESENPKVFENDERRIYHFFEKQIRGICFEKYCLSLNFKYLCLKYFCGDGDRKW